MRGMRALEGIEKATSGVFAFDPEYQSSNKRYSGLKGRGSSLGRLAGRRRRIPQRLAVYIVGDDQARCGKS